MVRGRVHGHPEPMLLILPPYRKVSRGDTGAQRASSTRTQRSVSRVYFVLVIQTEHSERDPHCAALKEPRGVCI